MKSASNVLLILAVSIAASLQLGCSDSSKPKPKEIKTAQTDPGFNFYSPGGFELPVGALVNSCPFISQTFDMTPLLNQIKTQLEIKDREKDECFAKQNALNEGLKSINSIYSNLNSELGSKKSAELYETFLIDLQTRISDLNKTNQGASFEAIQLKTTANGVEEKIRQLKSDAVSEQTNNENSIKNSSREALINYLNNTIVTAASMDAKCVGQIGGFQQVLPSVLSAASIATGVSIFSGQVIASAAFQLASSITRLFQNQDAKKALKTIIQLQNEKVIACTYYSIRHSTCEIERAIKLASEFKPELQNLGNADLVKPNVKPEWVEYLMVLEKSKDFSRVFQNVATLGSNLNPGEVREYFRAIQINPVELLSEKPSDDADILTKQKWLKKVRNKGVEVLTIDFNQNNKPIPLDEQVKNAIGTLVASLQFIEVMEAQLKETRSFDALKDNLNANFPQLTKNSERVRKFLVEQAKNISESKRPGILISARIMEKIVVFMEIGATDEASIPNYIEKLTLAGTDLFKEMTLGAVAQANDQQIIALGSKAEERLNNAYRVIENEFVAADVLSAKPFDETFVAFKQSQLLLYRLYSIYNDLKGPNSLFRPKEIEVATSAFEKGFEDDIIEILNDRVMQPNQTLETAQSTAQMCSLFTGFMLKTKDAKKVFDICKANYKKLAIDTINYYSVETVDYTNACFYNSYVKKTNSFRILDWIKINGTN